MDEHPQGLLLGPRGWIQEVQLLLHKTCTQKCPRVLSQQQPQVQQRALCHPPKTPPKSNRKMFSEVGKLPFGPISHKGEMI